MKKSFEKRALRVSLISIAGNIILSVLKLAAGIFSHSSAMISDAVHSASDVFSSIIVIIGVKMAAREADENHPYGHERFESAAAVILAAVLLITGLMIGYNAVGKLTSAEGGNELPDSIALYAALLSIICKEGMYRYTKHHAKRIDSSALMADAWHHRSDALSSLGALVGIAGTMAGIWWMDAAASLVICGFIIKASCDIFLDAIRKMVDHACSDEIQQAIELAVRETPGVEGIEKIWTREFGSRIYVDIVILADRKLTLLQSDKISVSVHDNIEKKFDKVKHISVSVRPD